MSNRLPVLAAEIKAAHQEAGKAARLAAERAIAAGHALVEAKSLVQHGEWLPFLKQAGVPERTAQRYMALSRSGLKSDIVTDLGGISAALQFLRLRGYAVQQLEGASAAMDGGDSTEAAVSLKTAILTMDRMVAMFPEHGADTTGGTA
jgi:hypothetical protein